jgi:hypothetical protein
VERAVGIVGELALGRRHAVTQPNHAGRSADAGGSAAAGALVGGGQGAKPNLKLAQGEVCATIEWPDSSYSCLEIHPCWQVESAARMTPPIHTDGTCAPGAR